MKRQRLQADARRESILVATAPLFARHGPEGVTTRQLAAAAGISEALLYRHFPDKQALYVAASQHAARQDNLDNAVPEGLPPSTYRLALTLHRLAEQLTSAAREILTRQLGQSLLGDGRLAQEHLARLECKLLPSLRADLQAAYTCKDIASPPQENIELWLIQHLFFGLQLHALPERSPLDYHTPRFELQQRCVRFALRGLGLKEAAITREYRPEQLSGTPRS
ncbi:MAG: hypothetical protein C0624_00895 [Desulfuromonas sp.]|nr:MAG: hypothetical protein C0624_00895 [Desulfuromonas sp.]